MCDIILNKCPWNPNMTSDVVVCESSRRDILYYSTASDLQVQLAMNIFIFKPFLQVKYNWSTRICHQPDTVQQSGDVNVKNRKCGPICRWEPAHSPLAFISNKPDPAILPQS